MLRDSFGGRITAWTRKSSPTVWWFGATSPACSGYALRHTVQDNKDDFTDVTVDTVRKNVYVDNCLKSVASTSTAQRLVLELCALLARGGFRLTKWVSNHRSPSYSTREQQSPTLSRAGSWSGWASHRTCSTRGPIFLLPRTRCSHLWPHSLILLVSSH